MASYGDAEDSYWDDDDLDQLADGQLVALEKDAIQFTQHQTQSVFNQPPNSSNYSDDDFEDDDLDDAVVYDETQVLPSQIQQIHVQTAGVLSEREQFRQARYAGPSNIDSGHTHVQTTSHELAAVTPSLQREQAGAIHSRYDVVQNGGGEVEALQRQVQELLRAQESYKQELDAKVGEIAIVRTKQERSAKEYERELNTIKKLNADRIASQHKAIEAAREAERTIATELEFVKKDLIEEAERVRTLKKAKAQDAPVTAQNVTTPRKPKTAVHRDGFDDDEIQVISPTKFRGRRSNGGTPTKAGAKRKRKDQDSPTKTLVLESEPAEEKEAPQNTTFLDEALLERLRLPDDRLGFLESILNYRQAEKSLKTIEEFAQLSFPSAADKSFASLLIGKLPTMNQSAKLFPIELCEMLVSLWSKCLEERYYKAISLLVDLLTFALELKTMTVAPFVVDSMLPVAQGTADLVAIPRFKREKYEQYKDYVDASACLQLIHLVAQGCMSHQDHRNRFWRLMRLDFVLVMLSPYQPLVDSDIMLQLLAMSVTRDSIGPRAVDQEAQRKHAVFILDRMSLMLIMHHTMEDKRAKASLIVIKNLRLQCLRTFQSICQSPWGGEAIALHRHSIGRLFKFMSDELDALYDHRPDHKQSARLINLATRILHTLLTKHEAKVDLPQKLSIVHGGSQKHLISLARLFSIDDGLLLEAGIEPQVSECAQEMLNLSVTPEEGEAIHAAFVGG